MAKGNGGLSPESAEFVADVLDAALHGAGLTRRLLAFARRGKLDSTDVEINDLVGGIFGLIRCTLGEDISIATELARDVWAVHADAAQLEAAIVNLATNARDAMRMAAG